MSASHERPEGARRRRSRQIVGFGALAVVVVVAIVWFVLYRLAS